MNEVVLNSSDVSLTPSRHVPFLTRLATLIALWLLAAVAIQLFLPPEGLTETDKTPFQQRLIWPAFTIHMIVVGLAQAATWPSHFPSWGPWFAFGCLAVLALLTLVFSSRRMFYCSCAIQAALLALGVIYFVGQSHLPTGG